MLGSASRSRDTVGMNLDAKEAANSWRSTSSRLTSCMRTSSCWVAPALCLLVFGRTLDEAMNQARDSLRFRLRETGPRPDPVISLDYASRDAYQFGRTAA